MAKRNRDQGIPLIRPKQDDCPRGGDHEDLPWVQQLESEQGKIVVFYCLKCRLLHWALFPNKEDTPAPATEPTMTDDNPILDGVPHA